MKKVIALLMSTVVIAGTLAGCGTNKGTTSQQNTGEQKTAKTYKVAMVTDTGGVSDQSFNQSSWEGLQSFSKNTGAQIKYLESKQETDYVTNLDKLVDENNNLISRIVAMSFCEPRSW